MKRLVFAILFLATAVSASAQASRDPDRAVTGSGIRVAGWQGRTDRSNQKISDVRFVDEDDGFRVTTGPHVILWNPGNQATGDYEVSATFTKTPESASAHEESYGLFIAGADLSGPRQNYLYCVVFGSGSVMVRHRGGSHVATLLGKTANRAIAKMARGGATDRLSLWVRGGRVGCSVNGVEVFSAARADMVGPGKLASTDGLYGLRVSHNLNVRVLGFEMTAGK